VTLGAIRFDRTVCMLDSDPVIRQPRLHHFFVAAQAGRVTDITQIPRAVRARENNVGEMLSSEFNSTNNAARDMARRAIDFGVWRGGCGVYEGLLLMA